jgi:hypothetical protein
MWRAFDAGIKPTLPTKHPRRTRSAGVAGGPVKPWRAGPSGKRRAAVPAVAILVVAATFLLAWHAAVRLAARAPAQPAPALGAEGAGQRHEPMPPPGPAPAALPSGRPSAPPPVPEPAPEAPPLPSRRLLLATHNRLAWCAPLTSMSGAC